MESWYDGRYPKWSRPRHLQAGGAWVQFERSDQLNQNDRPVHCPTCTSLQLCKEFGKRIKKIVKGIPADWPGLIRKGLSIFLGSSWVLPNQSLTGRPAKHPPCQFYAWSGEPQDCSRVKTKKILISHFYLSPRRGEGNSTAARAREIKSSLLKLIWGSPGSHKRREFHKTYLSYLLIVR